MYSVVADCGAGDGGQGIDPGDGGIFVDAEAGRPEYVFAAVLVLRFHSGNRWAVWRERGKGKDPVVPDQKELKGVSGKGGRYLCWVRI